MPNEIKPISKRILSLSSQLLVHSLNKNKFFSVVNALNDKYKRREISKQEFTLKLNKILKNRPLEYWVNYYKTTINNLKIEISKGISSVFGQIQLVREIVIERKLPDLPSKQPEFVRLLKKTGKVPEEEAQLFRPIKTKPFEKISKTKTMKYIDELKISTGDIKKFVKAQRAKVKKKKVPEEYSVYKSNFYSIFANSVMENVSFSLAKKYPVFFGDLFKNLRQANIKLLSKTYISIMLFTSLIVFPLVTAITLVITFDILKSLAFGVLAMPVTFFAFYYYPLSLIHTRRNRIKNELVFAIVHMAAVAGSGAQPIKVFELLIKSGEYEALEDEIKKVLNYVNLFGYSLTTSLKAVASTTPSPEFKELLNGIISTTETGGDLKKYLADKADDALTAFKLDQTRYLATISTYSDIYTGILIAAPLLFIVTLAILEKISPVLGSIRISTLATLGVFVFIPVLNAIFLLVLEMTKGE